VIAGASDDARRDIDVHFALRIPSLPDLLNHLERMKVKYFSTNHEERVITTRPDGIKQVYLQDPDGFWIEINDIRL
jgi:lactoylglutathione lyase